MAERKTGGKAAAEPRGVKQAKPTRKLTAAEKRKRAAERRKAKAEQARLARMTPSELVAEEEADRERRNPIENTLERARTYRELMRDWARGYDYASLGRKYELGDRRVREIVESLRGSHLSRLGLDDPMFGVKFGQDLVARKAAAVAEYTELADACTGPNQEHIRLGYLKQRDAAVDRFTELVQEMGWLPKHLGTLNVQMDALAMAEVLVDKLVEHGIADAIVEDIVAAIELRIVRRQGQLALAPAGPGVEIVDAEVVGDAA